jgi:hypothetical protein
MKKYIIIILGLFVGSIIFHVSHASAVDVIGRILLLTRSGSASGLPICGNPEAPMPGMMAAQGNTGEGPVKICWCHSDGAAVPTYQWCSLTGSLGGLATATCVGGTTTVCP